jgi:hypothetical protein
MQCNTSFTIPEENYEIHYQKMECQSALRFIQHDRLYAPYNSFSNVEVIKPHRILTSKDNYRLLSFNQFECLLTCCSETKNWNQYQFCKQQCLKKTESVVLNSLDAARLGKNTD